MNAYTKCETWMCVQIFVLSSQHNSGEQLDQYTGVAAILRFPIYDDDDDDEEEDSSARDASTTCSAPDGSAARSKNNRSSMQHHSSVKNGKGIMGTRHSAIAVEAEADKVQQSAAEYESDNDSVY